MPIKWCFHLHNLINNSHSIACINAWVPPVLEFIVCSPALKQLMQSLPNKMCSVGKGFTWLQICMFLFDLPILNLWIPQIGILLSLTKIIEYCSLGIRKTIFFFILLERSFSNESWKVSCNPWLMQKSWMLIFAISWGLQFDCSCKTKWQGWCMGG